MTQSSSTPGVFSFSHRELEKRIVTAGKDISVVSDFDWMAEGASKLLNEMVIKPDLAVSSNHHIFLQRYLLEMCRGLQVLGLSNTAGMPTYYGT